MVLPRPLDETWIADIEICWNYVGCMIFVEGWHAVLAVQIVYPRKASGARILGLA